MPTWAVALVVALILVLAAVVAYICFTVFNGPYGERYQKLRMQGPFVPDDEPDGALDAERSRRSSAKSGGHGDG